MGGNSPQSLVNQTALQIQSGEIDIAILAGGEATKTRQRGRAAGIEFDWPKSDPDDEPTIVGEDLHMAMDAEIQRGIVAPVQHYPMFETAIRAASGRTFDEHQAHLGRLYADLSAVAAKNPYAWIREAKTADEIVTVTDRNRMIGLPYPKLLNSNNGVDMAAAVIMCSVGGRPTSRRARGSMGVPARRHRLPRAPVRVEPRHVRTHTRDRDRRAPCTRTGGYRHRRRRR